MPSRTLLVAAYQDGKFVEGIQGEYVPNGVGFCGGSLVLDENAADVGTIFSKIVAGWEGEVSPVVTGIYELETFTRCVEEGEKRCERMKFEKISERADHEAFVEYVAKLKQDIFIDSIFTVIQRSNGLAFLAFVIGLGLLYGLGNKISLSFRKILKLTGIVFLLSVGIVASVLAFMSSTGVFDVPMFMIAVVYEIGGALLLASLVAAVISLKFFLKSK